MSPTLRRARLLVALRDLGKEVQSVSWDFPPRPRPYDWERDGR